MMVPTKNVLFRIVRPCLLVKRHKRYGEICYLHNSFSVLKKSLEIPNHGPVKQ